MTQRAGGAQSVESMVAPDEFELPLTVCHLAVVGWPLAEQPALHTLLHHPPLSRSRCHARSPLTGAADRRTDPHRRTLDRGSGAGPPDRSGRDRRGSRQSPRPSRLDRPAPGPRVPKLKPLTDKGFQQRAFATRLPISIADADPLGSNSVRVNANVTLERVSAQATLPPMPGHPKVAGLSSALDPNRPIE